MYKKIKIVFYSELLLEFKTLTHLFYSCMTGEGKKPKSVINCFLSLPHPNFNF